MKVSNYNRDYEAMMLQRVVQLGLGSRRSGVTMNVSCTSLVFRASVLFLFGNLVSVFALRLLQSAEDISFSNGVDYLLSVSNVRSVLGIILASWWVPPVIGAFAALVGLIYPCMDSKLGEPHQFRRDWTSVVRCVAVFVGISHFTAVSFSY